ncbi:ralBP1-associated Eps domain-containing protein 2-like isoform X2 [Eriocheir sinensis]|uniref:ralBP1-associated Eps domain-containing protein 2-like isoform X2 n=1 Tax=Eriocheir sinensis TaxID=95602 RepID=UPI0021C673A7|nr:ralBP1-associated Eps domain-containing protein 2-like isoform X2 [Eriocheir sinensis]
MESLTFTDNETKYYGDLFAHLDSEGTGAVPVNQVHEFLRASKLPAEVLAQIGQLCGGAGQGWYGRRELFVALKFVAAAQRGLPVRAESLFLGVDLPLPRLHTNNNTHYENNVAFSSSSSSIVVNKENCTSSPDLIQLSDSDCNTSQMVDGGYRMMESEDGEVGDERMSDPSGRMVSHSTSVSSPASDSPTPTNSVHEKTWNQAHTHWHGLINDEHRQLLGTEEDSSEGRSSGGGDGRSSGGGGAGEEEEEEEEYNVWSITEEQRQYYTEQFRAMQPDLTSLLSGTAAKEFFEKSKLPVNELSKIWQLSDVTRDGALSLQEFFTAMHLVVLRRNNIELPETLPPSLYPMLLRKSSSSGVEGGGNSGASGNSSVVPGGGGGAAAEGGEAGGAKATPDPLSPSRNKEWTKFVDSPTSTLSSPGLKPVNFDFQKSAVEQDPKILHPKAVRLTPESKRLEVAEVEGPASFSPEQALTSDLTSSAPAPAPGDLATGPGPAPTGPTGSSQGSPKKGQEGQDIKPIQRPLPRKPTGSATGGLPPPPQSAVTTPPEDNGMFGPISLPSLPSGPLPAGAKKEAPPPPPPRPGRTHARSSSLDLNKFSRNSFLGAPPAVPPRASPGATSPKKLIYQKSDGDMAGVEAGGGGGDALFPLDTRLPVERARTSAFEVYRKPHQEFASAFERVSGQRVGEEEGGERTRHLSTGARPKDKREIQASIRTTTEKNTILTRLNSELNQELAEVMEERIALEMQLEQMKPFSS